MDAELVQLVWRRAKGLCEYCQFPHEHDDRPFEIDHVLSRKHEGPTVAGSLAPSCFRCNSFKGSDIAGRDKKTRRLVPLFNPRRHRRARHFRWREAILVGRTPIGRVTIALLRINDPIRVEVRAALIAERLFPPEQR